MKVLVLLSGGVDSSTCLALAKEKYGDNVLALSMSYGQKHKKELLAAQAIADYYHVELLHMDLARIFAHSNCSLFAIFQRSCSSCFLCRAARGNEGRACEHLCALP